MNVALSWPWDSRQELSSCGMSTEVGHEIAKTRVIVVYSMQRYFIYGDSFQISVLSREGQDDSDLVLL